MLRLSFQFTSCIAFTEFVVLRMGEDVLHIHAVVDEGDDAQVVASDINNPPLVFVLNRPGYSGDRFFWIRPPSPSLPVGENTPLPILPVAHC